MTAHGSDSPSATAPAWPPHRERIDHLHQLAVRGVNLVLRLQTLIHCADGERHARDALLKLQLAVNELPALPLTDDPFAAEEVVAQAGVVATSMHAAAFAITRRTWQTVQLRSLAPEVRSEHPDESGQSYTRLTSRLLVRAATEVPWSTDVWQEVRQQLAEDPALDSERMEAQLALERLRAIRQLEARLAVPVTRTEGTASSGGPPEPISTGSASPAVPQDVQRGLSDDSGHAGPSPDSDLDFIPSQLQERILEALDQKALTLDALACKLHVDRSTLHRNGIKELMKRGRIDKNRRAGGYYRPDAPPPKYAQQLGRKSP
jgi:hypothetical protein